jgi:hypothetical protein
MTAMLVKAALASSAHDPANPNANFSMMLLSIERSLKLAPGWYM